MGVDYGLGRTNINHETGIRYGVISQHDVMQAWCDSAEPDYGTPTCPKCGNDAAEYAHDKNNFGEEETHDVGFGCADYICDDCKYIFELQRGVW